MLNLIQIQDRLKDMPTQAVMAYANGQSPMVPPYLALSELNRRKNMEQAVVGEQAKQQGEPPTVKQATEEQLGLMNLQKQRAMQAQQNMGRAMAQAPSPVPAGVGEEPVQMAAGGIARLPVRNIHRQAYAGGGIVAFQDGGPVPGVNLSEEELKEKYPNLDITDPAIQRQIRQKERYENVRETTPRFFGPGIGGGKPEAEKAYQAEDFAAGLNRLLGSISDVFGSSKSAQREEALKLSPSFAERQREMDKFAGTSRRTEPVQFEEKKTTEQIDVAGKPAVKRTVDETVRPAAGTASAATPTATKSDLERYEEELRKRGLDVAPQTGKGLEALRAQRQASQEPVYRDWTEGLLGTAQDLRSGQAIGTSRAAREKELKERMADLDLKIAQTEDLKAKADYEFKRGNFDKAVDYERQAKQLENQTMSARASLIQANKPNQLEAWVSLYKKDPEAALRYLGQAKAGAFTMEDALKAVTEDKMNIGLSDAEKVKKARELFNLMRQAELNAGSTVKLTKDQQALLDKYK